MSDYVHISGVYTDGKLRNGKETLNVVGKGNSDRTIYLRQQDCEEKIKCHHCKKMVFESETEECIDKWICKHCLYDLNVEQCQICGKAQPAQDMFYMEDTDREGKPYEYIVCRQCYIEENSAE